MPTPDDIKRTAEGIVADWCVKDNGDMDVLWKRISQALLSSRDQGYQEGVEDAVKALEEKKLPCSVCGGMHEAIIHVQV